MAKLNSERHALDALDALLAGGLQITQHYYDPDPNEWYVKGPMGNVGPFETPDAAVKAAIHALSSQLAEQAAVINALNAQLAALQTKLDQAVSSDGLQPWRRAFS